MLNKCFHCLKLLINPILLIPIMFIFNISMKGKAWLLQLLFFINRYVKQFETFYQSLLLTRAAKYFQNKITFFVLLKCILLYNITIFICFSDKYISSLLVFNPNYLFECTLIPVRNISVQFLEDWINSNLKNNRNIRVIFKKKNSCLTQTNYLPTAWCID